MAAVVERARRWAIAGALLLSPLGVRAGEAPPLPFESTDPLVAELFELGSQLEERQELDASTKHYEEVVALAPEISHVYWRIARNHFRASQQLRVADETGRRRGFEQVELWARRGIERDEECAECYLYAFIGLASLTRMEGSWSAARAAKRMKALLDRALELGPTHIDGDWNHELANAYFAAGVFYKVVPDAPMAGWILGARGDPELSRQYYRKAFALQANRIEFRMSLGSALLCEGRREGDPERTEEGLELIRGIGSLEDRLPTDAIDREHAATLLAHPERACDYSGDEWRRREGR
jgi:tetratricopeptide (TPR) repeat protein